MPSVPERKRKSFSVEDKIRIIRMIESGKSMAEVSREVGLSSSTVSTIWKGRECVKSAYEKNMLGSRRLQRAAVSYDVELALFQWYDMKMKEKVDVSLSVLREKAEEFAKLLGDNFFYVTYRWLERFKARYTTT
jgi:IS30 family transposase